MDKKKNILMVAYYAPPYGAVGAVRITKFVKYLLKLDWNVTIITVKEKYYTKYNWEWLNDVNGAKIIRTDIAKYHVPGLNEQGFYWIRHLKSAIKKELKKNIYDISYWTGGPFMHWSVAAWTKKKYGLKYVLDFRDPWFLSPYSKNTKALKIRNYIYKKVENKVIREASLVINVTEEATKLYENYYSTEPGEKFVTIYNGYDLDDFDFTAKSSKDKTLKITYTGKFGHFRDPRPFLQAFKQLIKIKNITDDLIKFVWIGEQEGHVITEINNMGLQNYVDLKGFIPYNEAMKVLSGSDYGLLIAGNHPFEPTTKIFDYLAINMPIIALVNTEGFITRTLSNVKYTYVVKNNKTDIYALLLNIYENKITIPEASEKMDSSGIFDRQKLTNKLREELLRLI